MPLQCTGTPDTQRRHVLRDSFVVCVCQMYLCIAGAYSTGSIGKTAEDCRLLLMITNHLAYFPDDQASKDLVSVQVQSD